MTYARQRAQAQRQIDKAGRSVTLRSISATTYSAASDAVSGGTPDDTTVKAVVTDFALREIDGTNVLAGDKKLLIAAADLDEAPTVEDIIVDGSDQYRIIAVGVVAPGDEDILYKLQVRK